MTDTDLPPNQRNDINFILQHGFQTFDVAQFFLENYDRCVAIKMARHCVDFFTDQDDADMVAY